TVDPTDLVLEPEHAFSEGQVTPAARLAGGVVAWGGLSASAASRLAPGGLDRDEQVTVSVEAKATGDGGADVEQPAYYSSDAHGGLLRCWNHKDSPRARFVWWSPELDAPRSACLPRPLDREPQSAQAGQARRKRRGAGD